VLSVEGADNGEWIIVDCGAAVAHIMQPAIRDYYRLEEIWGDKPVKMKIDGEARPALAPLPVKKATGAVKTAAAAKPSSAPKRPTAEKRATPAKKTARKSLARTR
jgi:ribosome-associated protein